MFQLYLLLRLKNFGSQAICKQWTTDIFFISKILAREERLELPTPGFGDRCSTN